MCNKEGLHQRGKPVNLVFWAKSTRKGPRDTWKPPGSVPSMSIIPLTRPRSAIPYSKGMDIKDETRSCLVGTTLGYFDGGPDPIKCFDASELLCMDPVCTPARQSNRSSQSGGVTASLGRPRLKTVHLSGTLTGETCWIALRRPRRRL